MEKDKLEIELVNSVACDNLSGLCEAIGEVALDATLDSGLLKDIPVFGVLIKAYSIGKNIQDQFFLKKVFNFLNQISEIPPEQKAEFINKFEGSREKKKKFGESILLLLEKADDMTKPIVIANLIKAYILGNLSYQEAFRLCSMVNRAYMPDLHYLVNFKNGVQKEKEISESLQSCGFLSMAGIDGGTWDGSWGNENSGGIVYNINKYGQNLVAFGFFNINA